MLTYRTDVRPPIEAIAVLYHAAPLYRPIKDLPRLQRMYDNANLVISAWDGDRLVGILRGWTDGAFTGYIADLAVHPDVQRQGVGKRLLEEAIATSPDVGFALRAADTAAGYYGHVGWEKVENGWAWPRPAWSREELFD